MQRENPAANRVPVFRGVLRTLVGNRKNSERAHFRQLTASRELLKSSLLHSKRDGSSAKGGLEPGLPGHIFRGADRFSDCARIT